MTNNENDIDIDTQDDDFAQDDAPKASIKEAWDNNPLMKVGAIVLGAAVLFGAYMIFSPKEEGPQGSARTNIGTLENVKGQAGGTSDIDEEMRRRLVQENERRTEEAIQSGRSSLPTNIDGSTKDDITIPQPPVIAEDPLDTWRQAAQRRTDFDMRNAPEQDMPNEKEPEIVPMPTPVRPQQAAAKMDPNAAKALADQMRVIISAQAPLPSKIKVVTREDSAYTIQKAEMKEASGTSGFGAMAGAGGAAGGAAFTTPASAPEQPKTRVIAQAGTIFYAQLLNELNSDIPGPALAHVLSGPFAGGRALGGYKVQEEYLVIEFSVIVKDGVGYTIEGIALDEKTTLAGHMTEINRHYFRRVILPAAAKFLEGYAAAAAQTVTSTTTTAGGGVIQQEEELDTKKELMKGVESAAGTISGVMTEQARRPVTVIVKKGTTFGILMLKTVSTDEVGLKVGVSGSR